MLPNHHPLRCYHLLLKSLKIEMMDILLFGLPNNWQKKIVEQGLILFHIHHKNLWKFVNGSLIENPLMMGRKPKPSRMLVLKVLNCGLILCVRILTQRVTILISIVLYIKHMAMTPTNVKSFWPRPKE